MNYKTLHATVKFSCNSPQLYTNMAATDRNLDKTSRNPTATFAKIGRNFTIGAGGTSSLNFTTTFCLLRSCGTANFSTKYRSYIVPLEFADLESILWEFADPISIFQPTVCRARVLYSCCYMLASTTFTRRLYGPCPVLSIRQATNAASLRGIQKLMTLFLARHL